MNKFDDMVKGLEQEIKVPEKVWAKYVETLENLPEKNRRVKHYTGRWAAAAAVMALVLLGTTTYAATRYFGLLDFMEQTGESVPEKAQELITKDIEQKEEAVTQDSVANYTVKEAMCDSETIYIVLEAKATEQGKYFFVPEDAMEEDLVSNWGVDSSMSVTEYAQSKGLTPIRIGGGIMNSEELGIASSSMNFLAVSDDVMDIMIESGKTQDGKTLDVVCQGTACELNADFDSVMRREIKFTLTDMSSSEKLCYVPEISDIPGTEARLEKVEVIQTDVGTYLEIIYYEDDSDFTSGLSFRLPGEMDEGFKSGNTESIGEGKWKSTLAYGKVDFGDSLSLEAYDCYEKTVFGTIECIKE